MDQFIGTKIILARPMTRQAYNDYRKWTLPADENGADEGFLVEHLDGGQANHPEHKGYISWSPNAVFGASYQPSGRMSFGHAIVMLKAGMKVARAGWNGKGMWLVLATHSMYCLANRAAHSAQDQVDNLPFIGIKTADNKFVPWLASQTDMLAEDWSVVS